MVRLTGLARLLCELPTDMCGTTVVTLLYNIKLFLASMLFIDLKQICWLKNLISLSYRVELFLLKSIGGGLFCATIIHSERGI